MVRQYKTISFSALLILFGLISGNAQAKQSAEQIAFLRLTDNYWQIWLMDTNGKNQRQLTKTPIDKVHMVWGKNNTTLLYNTNQGKTFVHDFKTKKATQVLEKEKVFDVAWSPDGKKFAFGVSPANLSRGKTSLWVSNADGTNRQKVAGGGASDAHYATWINNGDELFYRQCVMTSNMEVHHDFWFSKTDGSNLRPASGDFEMAKFDQTITQDGLMAYSSLRSGFYEIWTQTVSDKKTKQITDFKSYAGNPKISPNIKKIVFDSIKSGMRQIYLIDIDGKNLKQLTKDKNPSRLPVWSGGAS